MLQHLFSRSRAASERPSRLLPLLSEHIKQIGLIDCPLVLISQISRSGGTWLNQLFDHHPQVWAHPLELKIGYPRKWHWPNLTCLRDPLDAWRILSYPKANARLGGGTFYRGSNQLHPILFDLATHKELFLYLCARRPPEKARDWINAYFTAFFFSWLDYQRRYSVKRYITAFAAMLALEPESMTRFRDDYPDGWLISIIREPLGWYRSVKQRTIDYPNRYNKAFALGLNPYSGYQSAEAAYLANVSAIRQNANLFGDRFILLNYDGLVESTEAIMHGLAARIGLEWHRSLLCQTFNGIPIAPNSSFQDEAHKRASALTEDETALIAHGPMMAAYLEVRSENRGAPLFVVADQI